MSEAHMMKIEDDLMTAELSRASQLSVENKALRDERDRLREALSQLPLCNPASLLIFDAADENGYDVHGAIKEPYSVGWIGTFLHKADAESYIYALTARAAMTPAGGGQE